MREILFRGKHNNFETKKDEWVYGSFACAPRKALIYEISESIPTRIEGKYVDIKTVGQYTGLTDKNGKKIFEGDFVVSKDLCYVSPVVVEIDEVTGGWEPFVPYEDFGCCERVSPSNCEVIGNIHDNPELLKRRMI